MSSSSGSGKGEVKTACKTAAQELSMCMEKTACVKGGRDIMDCVKAKEMGDCEALYKSYFECRRSQLDMRTRIRGKRFHDTG